MSFYLHSSDWWLGFVLGSLACYWLIDVLHCLRRIAKALEAIVSAAPSPR